jgi:hypothetical protein
MTQLKSALMMEKMRMEEKMIDADKAELQKKKMLEEKMLEDDDSWLFASDVKRWSDVPEDSQGGTRQISINYPVRSLTFDEAVEEMDSGPVPTSTPAIILPFKKFESAPNPLNGKDEVINDEVKSTQVLVIPDQRNPGIVRSPVRSPPRGRSKNKKPSAGSDVLQTHPARKNKKAAKERTRKEKKTRKERKQKSNEKEEKELEKKELQLEILHGLSPLSARSRSILEENNSKYLQT